MVTDPHTQTNPQTGPITIHYTTKLRAQCNRQTKQKKDTHKHYLPPGISRDNLTS